jgi:V/A-type H+-transporting ATPase subunit F
MKKIIFLTPRDAEFGFSLAGIAHQVIEPSETWETLRTVTADPDAGLVILDERLLQAVGEERIREVEEDWPGIVLILPSPEKLPAEAEDYAARLIRRAIGYHVRLNV